MLYCFNFSGQRAAPAETQMMLHSKVMNNFPQNNTFVSKVDALAQALISQVPALFDAAPSRRVMAALLSAFTANGQARHPICLSTYIYVYLCMYVCVYVCMYVCMYLSIYLYIYTYNYVCICISIYICIYEYIYVYIYIYIYVYM